MGDLDILWSRFSLPWHAIRLVDEWTQIGRRRVSGSGIQRGDFISSSNYWTRKVYRHPDAEGLEFSPLLNHN